MKKEDNEINEYDLAKEEITKKEKWSEFYEMMRNLANEVMAGKIEPLDTYEEFNKKIEKIFPNFTSVLGNDYFQSRFDVYLSIFILKMCRIIARQNKEIKQSLNEIRRMLKEIEEIREKK